MNETVKLLTELTRIDTAHYRATGLSETPSQYKHEPLKFRSRLLKIYSKLSDEDLKELINIKTGK